MQPSVVCAKSDRGAYAPRVPNLFPNMRWFLLVAIVTGIVLAGIHPAFAEPPTRASVKPLVKPLAVAAASTVESTIAADLPTTTVESPRPNVVPTLDKASVPSPSANEITRSPAGSWARGRILVAPNAGLSDADFDTILSGVAAQSKRKLGGLNVHVIELPASSHGNEQAIARALSHNPHVKFAEVDEVVSLSATTNDPILASEWHIAKIGAQTAWNSSIGQNIVVAVIDTGVQLNHPDLYANLVAGWNVYSNTSDASDVQGHGTAVAGTIAAMGNNGLGVVGVAYGAKIMPIRATDTAANSTLSIVASALTWAADHGADVANISFSNLYKSSTVQAAAQYLRDRGGITVVSANNNAIDENSSNTTTMIAVSATDQNDLLASFSSWGSMVDLAAPGVTIQTTLWNSGYGWGTGTSFATPIVSGAVALVMAANPNLAPTQVESALFSNATDLGSGGYDSKYGWGRVNVASAVQAAGGAPVSDTTKPTAAIASPTGGTLSGLVPVSVSASDNVGVTRVELYAGGTLIGADTTPPYSFSWDSTKFANSGYALSALAYDAAGNVGTSAPIAVAVSNVTAPPPPGSGGGSQSSTTTSLTSSPNPSTSGASVTFTATVSGAAPTGTVRFTDGGSTIAGCAAAALGGGGSIRTATCATSALSVGTHGIATAYSGDSANAASGSATLSQVVYPSATSGAAASLAASFYVAILGRNPDPGVVDAWEQGYFDYAVAMGIDIRFAAQEMARLLFMSAEYAGRARTDSQFIQDAYQAFLHRAPSSSELANWLAGSWSRPQAVSTFAESVEFGNYIAGLFPGQRGNSTANFVATMYVGLLDRMPDAPGLASFKIMFDNAFAGGGIEAVRANARIMGSVVIASPEYQSKAPSNQTNVIRLYRAYLGRYPAASEIAYWSSQLDAHSLTTDGLINGFAASAEFTSKLHAYFGP